MTPVPRRALIFYLGGIEFVIRPGGVLLFAGIAAALDVTFLPLALPQASPWSIHLIAALMTVFMIASTLLHESGHAIAYRIQGIWPVRITLRGSGGACAAIVYDDSPARSLVRALAGPAMTLLVLIIYATIWHTTWLPPSWRLIAATLAVFSLFELLFNALPVHPRCDGTFALRSMLWLMRGREPEQFAVLYLWRPTILAAAIVVLDRIAGALGYLPASASAGRIAALTALILCAVPIGAMVWRWRYLSLHKVTSTPTPAQ